MRPRTSDPEIVKAAVMSTLWPQVWEWLKHGGWSDNSPAEDIQASIDDLIKACQYHHDGFAIAKALDDWEPDTELVNILDGFEVYREHRAAVAKWVEETQPTTPYKVGDAVIARGGWSRAQQGIIDHIDETHAEFRVRVPTLGHVAEGTPMPKGVSSQSFGWIVPWEDVKPVSEAAPSPAAR